MAEADKRRLHLLVEGRVQGVGMRPFVHQLATKVALKGFVRNQRDLVEIEVEGSEESLDRFMGQLKKIPDPALIADIRVGAKQVEHSTEFLILDSADTSSARPSIPLDLGPCEACLTEMRDPQDRRFRYPLISCSQCGPRFTILRRLPFDRAATAMDEFPLCNACLTEYQDPQNRRFHAQTMSCPDCGPELKLFGKNGELVASRDHALVMTTKLLNDGSLVAVKGVGGYQLWADAQNDHVITRLRAFKERPGKPLALLMANLGQVAEFCDLNDEAASVLDSSERPIVLLEKQNTPSGISSLVAPYSDDWGVMLPASPLHQLVIDDFGRPIVATSANRSGEPIIIHDDEAFSALAQAADYWLTHGRRIIHCCDDAVVKIVGSKKIMLRLGRGFGPLIIPHNPLASADVIAVGGGEKNAFALSAPDCLILGQHIGDLTNVATAKRLNDEIVSLVAWFALKPSLFAHDLHPGFTSSVGGNETYTKIAVQHHHAHALSCIAEFAVNKPTLVFAWDGTGYGMDGQIWGGEVLSVDGLRCQRVGALRAFPLPGGEKAVREPRRSALGLLFECLGERCDRQELSTLANFKKSQLGLILQALARDINCPRTSSIGRLFDAVASLLDLCHISTYSEQAPSALESRAARSQSSVFYEFKIRQSLAPPVLLDWQPLIEKMLSDLAAGEEIGAMAHGFHRALSKVIVDIANIIGLQQVALVGGVFGNGLLCAMTEAHLKAEGFSVYIPTRVPIGDGGLALGQALYARLLSAKKGGGHVSGLAG